MSKYENEDLKTAIIEQLQQLQMLMHRLSLKNWMNRGFSEEGSGKGIGPHRGQGRILALLKMKPEISQRELTYLLNMSKQALAQLLAKLEKSGYITKEASEEDKRVLNVKLTEAGAKAALDVDENGDESTKIFDCLNSEELAAFNGYLERIIKEYEEQFPSEDYDQRRKSLEAFISLHHHGHHGRHGHRCHHRRHRDCGCGSGYRNGSNREN